jgi:hypothetical protein
MGASTDTSIPAGPWSISTARKMAPAQPGPNVTGLCLWDTFDQSHGVAA